MYRRARPVAAAVLVAIVGFMAVATATPVAAQDRGATQRFLIMADDTSRVGRLVASGPISGVGTDTLLSHVENSDGSFTDTDRFDLPSGQVFLRDTYTATITSEASSCVTHISVRGTYAITSGNGRYTGASGEGRFTATGRAVSGRDPSGDCIGLDDPPKVFSEIVRGVGTTSIP